MKKTNLEKSLARYGRVVEEKNNSDALYQLRENEKGTLRELRIDHKFKLIRIRKTESRRFDRALWDAIGTPSDKSVWIFPGRKANTGVIWKRIVRDLYDHIEWPRLGTSNYDWKSEYEILKQRIEDAKCYDDPPDYLKYASVDLKITKAFERFLKELNSIHSATDT